MKGSGESGMNLRIPKNFWKFFSGCTTGGLSSSTQLHRVSCLLHRLRFMGLFTSRHSTEPDALVTIWLRSERNPLCGWLEKGNA
jgi:hypothetical protein